MRSVHLKQLPAYLEYFESYSTKEELKAIDDKFENYSTTEQDETMIQDYINESILNGEW